MPKNASYVERFREKYEERDGHWIWNGAADSNGYGHFSLEGQIIGAHRASYILRHHPDRSPRDALPKSLYVCHSCDIKLCVNPDHLFLGTAKDNMQDAARKGRLCKPEQRARGEMVNTAKLRADDVLRIRERIASGELHRLIADDYGVLQNAISKIATGRTWRHV